MMARFAAAATV